MSTTTFLLIRHGAHLVGGGTLVGRTPNVHLSPLGQEQVQQTAQRLTQIPIHALYSSPITRCQETAHILSNSLQLPIQTLDPLAEVDFGNWTGKTINDLKPDPNWQAWNAHRSGNRIPNGEMMLEIQTRIVREMLRLRDQHPDQTIALVSHGDVIKAAAAFALGTPLDLLLRIEISLASVTVINWGTYGPWMLTLNSTPQIAMPYPH